MRASGASPTSTVLSTKVYGKMGYNLEKAPKSGKTGLPSKVNSLREKKSVEAFSNGLTAACMLACSKKINCMVKACTNGQMDESTAECGSRTT